MNLQLSDEQAAALDKELHDIVENDPYPFSPRIGTLIPHIIRPEPLTSGHRCEGAAFTPVQEPLRPMRHYEPPSKGRYREAMVGRGVG